MVPSIFRNPTFLIGALVVALIVTYSNHFNNSFHFDDSHTVVNNNYIRSLNNLPIFFSETNTISSLPKNQTYRPLFTSSIALDYWLGGKQMKSLPFHVSMFLFFAVQCCVMYYLFREIVVAVRAESPNWFAIIPTAWYALHPVNAETINYITSRSDSYSTLFIVIALLFYIKKKKLRKYGLYLIPVGIACLFKQTGIMFAPILFVYIFLFEALPQEVDFKNAYYSIIKTLRLTLAAFLFSGAMYLLQDVMTPSTFVPGAHSVAHYLITQPYVILRYFTILFFPFDLSADTDWGLLRTVLDDKFVLGLTFLAATVCLICKFAIKTKYRPVSFGLAWFLIALVPTSSVIPLSEVTNDHRVFFPFVGLVFAVAYWVWIQIENHPSLFLNSMHKKVVIFASVILILSAFAYGTHQRNITWNSEKSLWKDVTEKSPKNGRGLMNYGIALLRDGDYAQAEQYFNLAYNYLPYYSYLQINLGVVKSSTNRLAEAEDHFKMAIRFDAENPESHYFYGKFLFEQQEFDAAMISLEACSKLSPGHVGSNVLLMKLYYSRKDWDNLRRICVSILNILPEDQTALFYFNQLGNYKTPIELALIQLENEQTIKNYAALSFAYYNDRQYQNCIGVCYEILSIDSLNPHAYNTICSSYNQLKLWDKAIAACNKAVNLKSDFQLAKNNLSWAEVQKESENE